MRALIDTTKGAATRRRFLARLAVAVATGGVSVLWQAAPTAARKRKKRKKKRRNNGGVAGGGSSGSGGVVVSYTPDAEEAAFLSEINAYRLQKGLSALALQTNLGAAAESHAQTMAGQNRGWFHSNLAALLLQFGYTGYLLAGENVADGYETASQVFAAWKRSATHDANMLHPTFNQIGIGRAVAAGNRWYWSTAFGAR